MSFEGKISGSLSPQGARVGSISGNIGAVVPDIRDESVTTAKLADEAVTTAKIADAAVTIAKLAQDVTALINSKGDASDVAQLQTDVAALQTITEGLGTASTYGVANNLTQAAAGANVLDAYQGKVLGDRMTAAEGNITTLNDGYTQLSSGKADNGVPLKGAFYMTYKGTGSSGVTVTFTNAENRYIGLLFTEQNSGNSAIFVVRYKQSNTVEMTRLFGATSSTYQAVVESNGDIKVYLDSWSKATFIGTQRFS